MKKVVCLATMFATVAILGTALTGAVPDETSASKETSTNSARPCCQAKSVDATSVIAGTAKPDCCPTGQAKATVLAKSESCSADSCNAGKKAAGDCKRCAVAGDVATKSSSSQGGNAGQCGGKCGLGAGSKETSEAKAGVQKCENCSGEDCKEECSSCAEARKQAATAENDLAAADGNGQGPERGRGMGMGRGMGRGRGMGQGHAGDSQHEKDHKDFFFLIEHRDSIRRTVKNLPNGIETLTESDAADVTGTIQEHVEAMYDRMENVNPIRMRDPLFREIFAHANEVEMEVEHTDHGVRVRETSDDEYVVKLLQEHAKVVSLFIKNGYSELPKNHVAPNR